MGFQLNEKVITGLECMEEFKYRYYRNKYTQELSHNTGIKVASSPLKNTESIAGKTPPRSSVCK